MTDINKTKFLAELGRLLTFMHSEDRKTALDMYDKLFAETVDEQALLQMLVSPTRQAVVMARSYDAAGRKMDLDREDDEGLPEFVIAIDKIYQSAAAKGLLAEEEEECSSVLENQVSLFDEVEELPEELVEEPAPEQEEEPEAEKVPAEERPVEELPAEEENKEPIDEVDAFLAEFSISDEALGVEAPQAEENPAEEEETEATELPAEEEAEEISAPAELQEEQPEKGTVRKARVGLLILYLLFAIPLTAAGVILMLVPTLLVLALAALVITAGVATLLAAFSGFAVFADILIVLGAALIILALGLLLLWLFVWFVGGAIVGLIHGAISLGGKWCYKEVPAV